MKKIIPLLCVLPFLLVGCSKPATTEDNLGKFVIIDTFIEDTHSKVYRVYDKETRVMYLLTESSSYGNYTQKSISPYYDKDGNIGIWKGE